MKADYVKMAEIYDLLNGTVDTMIDCIKDAKRIVNKMNNVEHWSGNGYESYNKKFNNLSQNFGAYCNELYVLNNVIKQTITKYKEVDKKVMKGL